MKTELIVLISLGLLFGVSSLISSFVDKDEKLLKTDILFSFGWVSSLTIFVMNWVEAGEPPLGNMFHVAVVVTCCLYPFWKFLAVKHKQHGFASFFIVAQIIFTIGAFFMWKPEVWVRPPALQSIYFIPHVLSYMMGYALATVAFLIVITAVLRSNIDRSLRIGIHIVVPTLLFLVILALDKTTKSIAILSTVYLVFVAVAISMRSQSLRLASVSRYDEAAYRVILLCYPFLTIGLGLGALWAEEAWGQYWSWDRKEVWSLITWVLYAIFFHCRKTLFFRKCSRPVHLLAYLALIITFLLVNLLPKLSSSLHSYAN